MSLSIEEALRVITEKAAVVRFLTDTAAQHKSVGPDPAVLSGIGAVCGDIEALSRRVKAALKSDVLDIALR